MAFSGRTSLEIAMANALAEAGFEFEEQYQLSGKNWLYDFYLPNLDLLIETDGDFFHYSDWAREQGQPKRDKLKTKHAQALGYRLVRIKESEVQEYGADEIVRAYILPVQMQYMAMRQLVG